MVEIQVSDELNTYIETMLDELDDDYETFEQVVWALIDVVNVKQKLKYEVVDSPLYG